MPLSESPRTRRRPGAGPLARFFRTPEGELVLHQPPNAPITAAAVLHASARLLSALRVVGRGSGPDRALRRAGTLAFLWWAGDELLRGATAYRRTIGAVSLLAVVVRVCATRSRAKAADPWRSGP